MIMPYVDILFGNETVSETRHLEVHSGIVLIKVYSTCVCCVYAYIYVNTRGYVFSHVCLFVYLVLFSNFLVGHLKNPFSRTLGQGPRNK